MSIDEIKFVVFDLETTGFRSGRGDRIVEIGAILVQGDQILDRFQALVHPKRKMPPDATAVNHITDAMLAGKPCIEEVLPGFLTFIASHTLMAHNAPFDLKFISWRLHRMNLPPLKNQCIDTLALARAIMPELPNHKLATLANHFKVKTDPNHRALADVAATFQVFRCLLKEVPGNVISLRSLLQHKATTSIKRTQPKPPKVDSILLKKPQLFKAIKAGEFTKVQELIEKGEDMEQRDSEGRTALHVAVVHNQLDICEYLLEAGADPNVQEDYGETPLHWMAKKGELPLIITLLQHNADPKIRAKYGKDAIQVAEDFGHTAVRDYLKKHG